MSEEGFHIFLGAMSITALIVFIALYFVKAGYGIFRTASWGYSINNKLAWVLMEAPVFIVMCWLWGKSGVGFSIPVCIFFLLFQLHYFQRSFVFPFLLKGRSRMPVAIMAMGIVFNILNGMMQAGGLFYFAPSGFYTGGWAYLLQPHALSGLLLFFAGMVINLHSDRVIRRLRKPGDTKHYLPSKGFYRYVTSANYFGELVEWTGFAILTLSPAAWVFVWWTFANLVPRADAIHRHYREEFGDEAVGRRKRILPYIY
ncbi:DUF1295 domain-containing protein [Bacteroides gallinarum]|uniref:DUF1295 domain-containing protein n=1 Tax=Bacteroides gallinarum TaxID=376806 RepID=UPI00035FA4BD|nr:DUF1295 domain-containing protein [Bacteroides gallinarum]